MHLVERRPNADSSCGQQLGPGSRRIGPLAYAACKARAR